MMHMKTQMMKNPIEESTFALIVKSVNILKLNALI
jgi:hypothetical protein